jgi:hypothetical protein
VLNGVGGSTIQEAQSRVSYDEFQSWAAYRRKRGSFNIGMRIERGAALLATMYVNKNSKHGGYKLYDFMPHETEPPLSVEQAMEQWR